MSIRSFVSRQGRITKAQARALSELWGKYGVNLPDTPVQLTPTALFDDTVQRWIVEIGFGDGESLAAMARAHPEIGFLGIEVHTPGIGHLLLQLEAQQIHNVRIIQYDAMVVLRDYIASNSLYRVQIYFPDPWPKARHHKRRLVSRSLADLLHTRLIKNGELHCATDWEDYAQWMRNIFFYDTKWQNIGGIEGFSERPQWRPETKFERRGRMCGHKIWDIRYQACKS